MTERVDCVVVGAGVVGLALARALARKGREVMLLEAAETFGTQTSSRNSEVIHAGVYYAPGSLKARLCVAGRKALYAFCADHGVTHLACEKLIVASIEGGEAERTRLGQVQERAKAAGVDLRWLSARDATALEPALRCAAALHSPETGIVDTHALMLALLGEAEAHGALFVPHAPVLGGRADPAGGVALAVGGADPMTLSARLVINAAGHGALPLSRAMAGVRPDPLPAQHFCKGSYFSLSGRAPFSRLIYPTPGEDSLGLHYTRDLGGRGRFGPDAEWITPAGPDALDYRVDPGRVLPFVDAIRRYWPDLDPGRLQPDYAGVRPKIQAPGEPAHDFVVHGPADTGIPGYMALYGIESPGLTSCLALADLVVENAPCP
ncbi:NAD(P)/FAD-dependent oxidoreductase [Pararhodospirillum oryzae]|uniref:FAD-dependent oxidoreductase n=1 Tax=Pararhodospirillum oryzae TaxID=478448 RepID=A0A512H7P4_9PROT|nr:NAD(P)/FAD-dependent oxidoreductase [Pararhodospirillum oryzae]GEO81477.1 FAD-dependent oxidoreductase [Pararhodospirillum oryzae]